MHHELQTDNLFDSFSGVWKRVTTEPRRFFEEMPITGGLQAPLLFLVICLAIAAVGFLLIGPRGFAFWIIVLGLVRAFVGALVLMVIARQIFHGTGDYEATFRALAYASAPVALLWLPLIRPLVVVYLLFLIIIGLERVQGFDATKAVLTMLLAVVTVGAIMWTLGLGHMVLPPGPFMMTHCP
ncbi:MAG: hypothetical protein E6J72_14480 [Deltaproteobacteria bacterium]|nr:MAG: hypothetical protein E6J72_14480 [Deltaproteobacteria bacterium]